MVAVLDISCSSTGCYTSSSVFGSIGTERLPSSSCTTDGISQQEHHTWMDPCCSMYANQYSHDAVVQSKPVVSIRKHDRSWWSYVRYGFGYRPNNESTDLSRRHFVRNERKKERIRSTPCKKQQSFRDSLSIVVVVVIVITIVIGWFGRIQISNQ